MLSFFPDPQHFDLPRISQVRQILNADHIGKKMRHFFPFLHPFRFHIVVLLTMAAGVLIGCRQRLYRCVVVSTCIIFFASLFYISLDGSIKHRVFFTASLPVLFIFFRFSRVENPYRTTGLLHLGLFALFLLILKEDWTIKKLKQEARVSKFSQQRRLVDHYLGARGNRLIPFGNDLTIQLYPPFNLSNHFRSGQIIFSGWATNIPFNKGRFDSFENLVGQNGIFFTKENAREVVPLLQANILKNYGMRVAPAIEMQSADYLVVKFHREPLQ
jgi:hypothetical protein